MGNAFNSTARAAVALLIPCLGFAQVKTDSNTFGGLSARAIGPAVMSGRISSIDAIPGDPLTIFAGTASGGVWKSIDAGLSFQPVFDDHVQSIGAVRVAPAEKDTVWVGTGESWTRNSVSIGDGVYKSKDGGTTWTNMGLAASERIGAIRISPNDSDMVLVCATGALWNASEERGVYRTQDGGETWEKVLYVDADTGCADLDMDPGNPNIIFASMWQFRRAPDFFESGGPGSGIYRSIDGGSTWQELTSGLPEEDLGRIAVAIAPSRSGTVYATVESSRSALYRSDDLGANWREMDSSFNVQARPFYFSEMVVDPTDHERVYKPGFSLTVSTDGGDSFSGLFGAGFSVSVHPDHHAVWIDPDDPNRLLLGTDGGLYISYDKAVHWRLVGSLPVSQFYHVAVDDRWPYNVYGGLQDNGSWTGPSRSPGGIEAKDWSSIGFGDGFWAFPDPEDWNTVFSEYQGGQLMRLDRSVGEIKRIAPTAEAGQEKLRFNWNTPLVASPNHRGRLYYGSQYLHVSDDKGESWTSISPDLTTDDPQRQRQMSSGGLTIDNSTAENNATIYSISESPLNGDIIWVGTDDGLLHVTQNGGQSWTNVTRNVRGVPAGTWVSRVEASPFDPEVAYVTFDGHRTGDMAPYVYRTQDSGRSWVALATDDIEGYAWVVKQDLVNPQVLFLGTELGLYVSLDAGQSWARFKENLPKVAVHDIVIHPTEHDVVLATHGRGVYIIDDISPLRALTAEVLDENVALLPSRDAVMEVGGALQSFGAPQDFVGFNPPQSATIHYYLKKRHLFGDLLVKVYDANNQLITTLPGGKRRGLNRVEWPMRLKAPKFPPSTALVPGFFGPRVPEGDYRFELIKGKQTLEGFVKLVPDPRTPHSKADRQFQQAAALELYDAVNSLTFLSDSLTDLAQQAKSRADESSSGSARQLNRFGGRLEALRDSLASQSKAGWISGEMKLREELGELYGHVVAYDGRPTQTQIRAKEDLLARLDNAERDAGELINDQLDALNSRLAREEMEPLIRMDRETWNRTEKMGGASPTFNKHYVLSLPARVNSLLF